MARPGITYEEVANAAIGIQGQNENPTVDRVRESLGTGSKSTIARYLKEWKSKSEHVSGSEGVPLEIISIVKGLWERLKSAADQQISQHQQDTDRIVSEINESLIQEQKRNHEFKQQIHHLEEQLHQESHRSLDLKLALEEEKRSNATLSERNERLLQQHAEQKSEKEKLHQLLSHVQNNLEHYQAAIQKLHEEQALHLEKQKADYEQKISSFKQNVVEAVKEKNQVQHDLKQIEFQLNLSTQQANELRVVADKLKNQIQEKILKESLLQQTCNRIEELNLNYQKKIEEQSQIILELEKRQAVFSNQISHLEKTLNEAHDKVQILRDEKLFIAQEKSHLEGQLKHFVNFQADIKSDL